MPVIRDISEMRRMSRGWRSCAETVCLVPTMGALHEGHMSLVRLALENADRTVVSIFVNPAQFGPAEDFMDYPRTLEGDMRKLDELGAHAIFAPGESAMYTASHATFVTVERLTNGLCGRSRPAHFRGVATVVAKLFNIVEPDSAVFGRKDAQQLAVIRRMVRDLNMDVDIMAGPIIREPDGLAMSSRNAYLSTEERAQAPVIHRALQEAVSLVRSGATDAGRIAALVRGRIAEASLAKPEYAEIVDPEEMTPVDTVSDVSLLAVAVRFGATRLIDNILMTPP
ncbi:MAG: pantoate--beta-alanine ligase [Candidatus Latescibacteria bacterium]|nr:pantoate--beta-alanine ligase [Candidatus Latescibacterota bacterium]